VRGNIDVIFLLIVAVLLLFGSVMSFSASSAYAAKKFADSAYFLKKYVLYMSLAVIAVLPFIVFSRPWFWKLFGAGTYFASLALLALVLVIGTAQGEAKRWIYVGGISFQPSEIAKLGLAMTLALFMSKYQERIENGQKKTDSFVFGVFLPGCIMVIPMGLIALEHHISCLLIVAAIGASVMFLGGTKTRWIVLLACGVAAAAVFLILVSDYAGDRVDIWLHIEQADPLDEAWQTLQGLYAIGSGGLLGKGLGNSYQKYGYVSEPQNDFIFTIICEELGAIGALLLIGLFGLLLWRGFKIAAQAPDRFSSLTVYALTVKTVLQAVLNIAVVTNSMPNTGISLPFFSSGGTALMLQIFEMGIILSISRFKRVPVAAVPPDAQKNDIDSITEE